MTRENKSFTIRKSKKYRNLCGAILAGALFVAIGTGNASADEVSAVSASSRPEISLMAETPTAPQADAVVDAPASVSTGQATSNAVPLAIDNASVTSAVSDAQAAGVAVTETSIQDFGTTTSSTELDQAQSEIASDQASQVASLEAVATQATDLKTASEQAETAYQDLQNQVSDAVANGAGRVTVEQAEDISSGDGTSKVAYDNYTTQVKTQIDSNKQALDQYNQELEAVKSNATINVDGKVTTQNVDQLTYGNSVQNGQVNPDGSFTFSHDMNDSMNDSLGILGTGTLNGKVNFTSTSNGDGSTTVNLESLDLYDYSYTSNRYNQGTGTAPDMNYHVYTDGQEIYSAIHDGNSSFTNHINRNVVLGQSYVLQPGQKTDLIPVLNIDDNWIINTHGQLALAFSNPNALPQVVVKSLNAPVKPVAPTAAYHNYQLSHVPDAPQPVKTVTDEEGNDINGQTYAGQKIQWHLTTDYSPYKDLSVSRQVLNAAILDDVQDGAFSVDDEAITMLDSQNKDVKDLFDMYHVLSDQGRTEAVQALLDQYGLNPEGEFYLWVAKDPESYFENYMRTNNNITVTLPATLLVDDGEKAENDFYQIDFNNPYESNLVWVSTPEKEVPVTPEQPVVPQAPEAPQAETPVQEQAILPQTGEEASTGLLSAGLMMALAGLGGLLTLKRNKQETAD